jgi:hypothetical protein
MGLKHLKHITLECFAWFLTSISGSGFFGASAVEEDINCNCDGLWDGISAAPLELVCALLEHCVCVVLLYLVYAAKACNQ